MANRRAFHRRSSHFADRCASCALPSQRAAVAATTMAAGAAQTPHDALIEAAIMAANTSEGGGGRVRHHPAYCHRGTRPCRRQPRRRPTRWPISTRASRSPSSSATGRAADTTSTPASSFATCPATFQAIRPWWCRTCRAQAACGRRTSSPMQRRRTAPRWSSWARRGAGAAVRQQGCPVRDLEANWIGNMIRDTAACGTWHNSGIAICSTSSTPRRRSCSAPAGRLLFEPSCAGAQRHARSQSAGDHGI